MLCIEAGITSWTVDAYELLRRSSFSIIWGRNNFSTSAYEKYMIYVPLRS